MEEQGERRDPRIFFKKRVFFFFSFAKFAKSRCVTVFSVRDLIFSLFSFHPFCQFITRKGRMGPSLPRNYLEKKKKTVPPPPTEFSQEVKDKKSPERSRKKRKSAGNGANSFSRQKNSPYYKSTGSSVFCHTFGEFSYFFPKGFFDFCSRGDLGWEKRVWTISHRQSSRRTNPLFPHSLSHSFPKLAHSTINHGGKEKGSFRKRLKKLFCLLSAVPFDGH